MFIRGGFFAFSRFIQRFKQIQQEVLVRWLKGSDWEKVNEKKRIYFACESFRNGVCAFILESRLDNVSPLFRATERHIHNNNNTQESIEEEEERNSFFVNIRIDDILFGFIEWQPP